MTGRRLRPYMLLLLAAVAVGIFLVTVPTFREFFDLGVYRGAVRHWLVDGGDLYEFRYLDTDYGFTYPPFAALVMSPLAAMSWPVAVAAGLAVNTMAVALLLRWFLTPVVPGRLAFAVGFLAVLVFEPARDTFSFGQINLVLLVLVCADLRRLQTGRRAGVAIGLAAALKLTPAVFIGYLILSRQYRAAATAAGTAAGVTLLTALIAPEESRTFWTSALWDTSRVGREEYVSNQSLRGVVARLEAPSTWWLVLVVLVVAGWCWWVRTRRPDHLAGIAMTGLVACLISPITWVHHLVWLLPALFLLAGRRRWRTLAAAGLVLSSSLVWLWWDDPDTWSEFLGANAYVWVTVGLAISVAKADDGSTGRSAPAARSSPSASR
jgi:alpha-1,2-mannosyltransferase